VSGASSSRTKPVPSSSVLKPWDFDYAPSPDGKDANLLIMFHGMGDTKTAFAGLGRQLNLPSTAILSLQAPLLLPLLESPAWSWYNTFTPMFEPLPNPSPAPTIPPLMKLLETLTSAEIGWSLDRIHLFGWGQGGTMALELALVVGKDGVERSNRLGSVVSVCAGLLSHPSSPLDLETPALLFLRQQGAAGRKVESTMKRAFKRVEVVRGEAGRGEDMPRGRAEWEGIMRFWGEVLHRGDEGWKGEGEVYEVV